MAPSTENLSFSIALHRLRSTPGMKVSRTAFNNTCYVMLQTPDEHSKMTKPYLYMVKNTVVNLGGDSDIREDRFPIDLSCESILADDWYILD